MTEDQIRAITLESLQLTTRTHQCLHREDIRDIGGVIDLIEEPKRLVSMQGFGTKSFFEILEVLRLYGVKVTGNPWRDGLRMRVQRRRGSLDRIPGTSVYLLQTEIASLLELGPTSAIADKLEAAIKRVR